MAKYPHVVVKLIGEDGNAFSIMGRVTDAMRRARVSKDEIDSFRKEAMAGDYDHLLQTVMKYVEVEDPEEDEEDDFWSDDEEEDDDYWRDEED